MAGAEEAAHVALVVQREREVGFRVKGGPGVVVGESCLLQAGEGVVVEFQERAASAGDIGHRDVGEGGDDGPLSSHLADRIGLAKVPPVLLEGVLSGIRSWMVNVRIDAHSNRKYSNCY